MQCPTKGFKPFEPGAGGAHLGKVVRPDNICIGATSITFRAPSPSTQAKVVRPSSHTTTAPSWLSSSLSQAKGCSYSSMITAEEGPDEGTEALHQLTSKGRRHDKEMSPNEHRYRMTHLAGGKARLKEAPDPGRRR
jgi:hypothetical protein